MREMYEACLPSPGDSSLVRAWKIGLSDFPFSCSNILPAFGRKTSTCKRMRRVCLFMCVRISHSVLLWDLGNWFLSRSCFEAWVEQLAIEKALAWSAPCAGQGTVWEI